MIFRFSANDIEIAMCYVGTAMCFIGIPDLAG
jgi:hypothetical protein